MRGLHLDAVDSVYVLGLPANADTYLHLAGRTGRWPRVAGKVVTIARPGELARLRGWSDELGGVEFRPLELPATAGDADDAGSDDAEEASSDISSE